MPIPGKKTHRYPIKATYQDGGAQTPLLDAFVVFDEEQPEKVFIETSIDSRIELELTPMVDAVTKYFTKMSQRVIDAFCDSIITATRAVLTEDAIDKLDHLPDDMRATFKKILKYGNDEKTDD